MEEEGKREERSLQQRAVAVMMEEEEEEAEMCENIFHNFFNNVKFSEYLVFNLLRRHVSS